MNRLIPVNRVMPISNPFKLQYSWLSPLGKPDVVLRLLLPESAPSRYSGDYQHCDAFAYAESGIGHLPPSWTDSIQPPSPTSGRSYAPSNFSNAIVAQIITCRMSGSEEGTEAAHLCPRSELEWSWQNRMSIYNTIPVYPRTGSSIIQPMPSFSDKVSTRNLM